MIIDEKFLYSVAEPAVNALEANGFPVYSAENAEEALAIVKELLPEGCTVACGGSMTLAECGIEALLKSGTYQFIDRYEADLTEEQKYQRVHEAKAADWYFSGCNAVTAKGELYNVDAGANRISSIMNGPKNVLIVCGVNKIVPDLSAAAERVRTVAAPKNVRRFGLDAPCLHGGSCADCGENHLCCFTSICSYQRAPRIRVLMIAQELGF